MVCGKAAKNARRLAAMKDPCDPDTFLGIPIPILLNVLLVLLLLVSFYVIYRCYYERFKCYAQNVIVFFTLFAAFHSVLHSHNFYEKVFCSTLVVALFSAHWIYLYRRATRQNEWCRFWYNMVWSLLGFGIAIREYQMEVTYCHCYYLDVLAAAWAMMLKEYYIVEGYPEPIACHFFMICEGLLIAGLAKGAMTQGLKYFEYLTDPCINTPIDYMVPID